LQLLNLQRFTRFFVGILIDFIGSVRSATEEKKQPVSRHGQDVSTPTEA